MSIQPETGRRSCHLLCHGWPLGHEIEQNEPDTRGHILCDPSSVRSLEESESQRPEVGEWEPGAGSGMGSERFMRTQLRFGKVRTFWRWWWGWLHNSVKVLDASTPK